MADGAADAAAAAGESTAVAEPKQPHRLERKWTFWFDNQSKPKQGAAWGSSLRKVYTFHTVEEFWWYVYIFISFVHNWIEQQSKIRFVAFFFVWFDQIFLFVCLLQFV